MWFDAELSFSEHIKRTCKTRFLQMRDLHRIRQYLTPKVAVLAANALVSSHLDYCNSLFRGLSCFNQHKLQSIQNTLARIVTNHRKYAHVIAYRNHHSTERLWRVSVREVPFFLNYLPLTQYLLFRPSHVSLFLVFNPQATFSLNSPFFDIICKIITHKTAHFIV